jgi:3-oxoacyl-[acyl-carrier protein] reductase
VPASTDTVLTDAVVIVTGGSTGSGRELARVLAGRGYAVVVVYLADQSGAEATVDEIVGMNGTAIAVRADIADELDVERLFSETVTAFGGVDVIVHADPRAARFVNQQAARQLRDCGAIVTVGISEAVPPFLINKLLARGITIAGPTTGPQSSGSCPDLPSSDISYCVTILDRWRLGPKDSQNG